MSEENSEIESTSEEVTETPEVNEEVETPKQKEEKKEATQSLLKKFKLKVDGEEIEEEIDLADEARLVKELQLARAAKKRMAEAQDEKRKLFELAKQFENPEELLLKMGDKGNEIAEKILLKKLQAEMMSPEQRQLIELQEKLARYEQQEKALKEKEENERISQLESREVEKQQKVIIDALTKTGLPPSPELVKRAAALQLKNLELGLELDSYDLAQEIMSETTNLIKSLVKSSEGESLLKLLGDDAAKKIRKYDIEKLKEKQKSGSTKSLTQTSMPETKKRTYQTMDEWRNEISNRLKE